MILYVNSCVRKNSRTDRLAKALLNRLGEYEEIRLTDLKQAPLNEKRLDHRTEQIDKQNFDDEIFEPARQFAGADIIVISAPYWDGSFPAILKTYLENIYCIGVVTGYDEHGMPVGMCRAEKLYYVTTAGGNYDRRFSYDYIEYLTKNMFGISDTELVYAENLDMEGNDAEAILDDAVTKYLTGSTGKA